MEIYLKIIAMPLIGFVIGYFTNYLAIKMLFYPRKKILGIQGILPKRKKEIAKRIADVSPSILPYNLDKIEKIPFVGKKAIDVLKKSIEEKVSSFSEDELEKIVFKVVKKELGFISLVGGIIGALIGIVQSVLLFF